MATAVPSHKKRSKTLRTPTSHRAKIVIEIDIDIKGERKINSKIAQTTSKLSEALLNVLAREKYIHVNTIRLDIKRGGDKKTWVGRATSSEKQ